MFHRQLFGMMPERFSETYRCYSVSLCPGKVNYEDLDKGGKIIMPASALDALTRLHIQYPMLFKLTNKSTGRVTHCGVLEFVADEGRIYIPYWMMQNLHLEEGGYIVIENVSLKVATFARFEPQSTDFLDISNPKAVLENALREFACLTKEDIIAISYNSKVYELRVLETQPEEAISIIECDMSVDFAAPVGYDASQYKAEAEARKLQAHREVEADHIEIPETDEGFKIFGGVGQRLDGKEKKSGDSTAKQMKTVPRERGIPNYNYEPGTLNFIRQGRQTHDDRGDGEEGPTFTPFDGAGHKLKTTNSKSRK